jgi:uncharacterized protein (DUF1015 family)
MATLRAFRALRPPPERATFVAALPYDVINSSEARTLAEGNPDSYLYVSRPEIALDPSVDEHDDQVYSQARVALEDFIQRGVLVQDATAHFYVYSQVMGTHKQTGLVACATVDEYDSGVIKRHEKTRADKEDDRTRHIDELGAHDEPVFLTYYAQREIDAVIEEVTATTPAFAMATSDGVKHALWVVDSSHTAKIEQLFASVPTLYIADGHHRSAAASRVHALRKQRTDSRSTGEHDVFMAVVFPHNQMQIMPYNRLVRDLKGRSADELFARLSAVLDLRESDTAAPTASKSVGLYIRNRWYQGTFRENSWDAKDPVASLDCSLVQEQILAPIFAVHDPRKDKHVDFVGGIRGAAELERRVQQEQWSLAIHMYATSINELIAVSDAGLLMPPKSTWFEPKLRSGLFVHKF